MNTKQCQVDLRVSFLICLRTLQFQPLLQLGYQTVKEFKIIQGIIAVNWKITFIGHTSWGVSSA